MSRSWLLLLPLILIFVVFWFLLIRPQQKKMKQHREMITAIRRGDRVLTGGGIIGTVSKVLNDTELQVEIAEGVRVKVLRSTVSEVLAKTEPAKGRSAEEDEDEVLHGLNVCFAELIAAASWNDERLSTN